MNHKREKEILKYKSQNRKKISSPNNLRPDKAKIKEDREITMPLKKLPSKTRSRHKDISTKNSLFNSVGNLPLNQPPKLNSNKKKKNKKLHKLQN